MKGNPVLPASQRTAAPSQTHPRQRILQRAMKKAAVANTIQVASDGQQAIDYLKGADKFADRESFPLPCLALR